MNNAMYKRYKNVKPIGVMHLTNCFGIAIFEPDETDKYNTDVIAAWSNTEGYTGFHKHMIHYTSTGRAYIRKGSMRIYLDEVIKLHSRCSDLK